MPAPGNQPCLMYARQGWSLCGIGISALHIMAGGTLTDILSGAQPHRQWLLEMSRLRDTQSRKEPSDIT
ncbi:hypothetical protein BJB45_14005 [Halomonas huangheensis]|uniref:Uncharacterized protein n=1 Tax=Halomonas huangheensis TaxID=1178482 RepID=W1N7P3_9GAMM|nr:hypothetical protein BJB45_14005 [Halomonas huangheensis]